MLSPWSGAGDVWCLERVLDEPGVGPVGYTAITAAGDALYAVLPMRGQLVQINDTDNDRLPDAAVTLADELDRPTGLTAYENMLYVVGMNTVYRYDRAAGTITTLIDDLPGGWDGYPSGGVVVHEGWLYVGVGGNPNCTEGRGAVWRYRLDGSNGEQVATGIEAPMGLAVYAGGVVVADAARDRLWGLRAGADYGACSGADAPAALHTFEPGAAPVALAAYPYDTFPIVTDRLLVALQGSVGQVIIAGYEVIGLDITGATSSEAVLPRNPVHLGISDQRMHIQGSGFYPQHVYGVTVDDNGWIYISAGNGQIVALRPL